MPELPEVETLRRQLALELVGKTVREVEVRRPTVVKNPLPFFRSMVNGARIVGVERRAKFLLIQLANHQALLVHLRMTGQLVFRHGGRVRAGGHPIKNGTVGLPNKFTHIIFHLKGGSALYFNDVRRFGFIWILPTEKLEIFFQEKKIGPEPLSKQFTLEVFRALLQRKKRLRLKPLLMDQTFIAGIGNIYAVESCFRAGIRPTRRAASLSPAETKKLYQAIKKILLAAITKQGSSPDSFIDAYGDPGRYVPSLYVYGRAGERCRRCGSTIKSLKLAARSTAYCLHCQR